MRAEDREQFQKPGGEDVFPPGKLALEAGLHEREFAPVILEETTKTRDVVRREGANLPVHLRAIGRAIDLATRAESEAVLRIQSHQIHLGRE